MFIVSFPECYTFEVNTFATKNSIVKLQHATVLAGSVSVSPGDTSAPMWSSQIKKKNTFAQKGVERGFSGAQYFNWFAWSIQYQPRCGRRNKNFLPVCLRRRNKQINYNYCPLCPPWYINIKWCKGAYENTWILVNWRGGRAQVALQWTMRRSCLHKHHKVNITHFLKSTFLLECILLLECGVEMVREGPRAAALKTRRGSVTWTLSEGVWLLCSCVLYNNDYSRR